jgi:hypothetical protein
MPLPGKQVWDAFSLRRSQETGLLAVRGVHRVPCTQQVPENHAMCVTCYLIWGLAIAVCVVLLVYAIFL